MKYLLEFKKYKSIDYLSGVLLIVEDRVLLVLAKKHKRKNKMWSIPKGHIEGKNLKSAIKELGEETGIKLDKNYDKKVKTAFVFNKKLKKMKVYIYKKSLSDISKYVKSDFTIKKKTLKKVDSEIYDVKFFKISEIENYLQKEQLYIFNKLFK